MMYEAERDEICRENCGELIEQQPRVKKSKPQQKELLKAEQTPYSIWDDCDRPGWM